MIPEEVAAFRRFNRFYTKLIGTLNESLLETGFSLAEARVIYELATREAPVAKEIAAALGMDPGYLSRVLSKLEDLEILSRKISERDGRRADLTLTRKGKSVFTKLDDLSAQQAQAILEPLPAADRTRLASSMATIESVISGAERGAPIVLRPHRPGDMGWVVYREAAVYAEEYGFNSEFESLISRIAADFLAGFDPARERCWMAEADRQPAGHVFLVKHPSEPDTAKLRLLMVERHARGKGLGQTLVNECIRFARETGYRKITLWTQSILLAAQHIYRTAGFQLVNEEPHHSFGKDLIGQTWELLL
jgi:DNA-binding MarR family transcriptional regulator/GNAT superfamily N-acetyltransferase